LLLQILPACTGGNLIPSALRAHFLATRSAELRCDAVCVELQ
jgi:hypothetical protein